MRLFCSILVFLILSISSLPASAQIEELPINIMDREQWDAKPPIMEMVPHTPKYISLHHSNTNQKAEKSTQEKLQALQNSPYPDHPSPNIPFHFYIAANGTIAEGRKIQYEIDSNTNHHQTGHISIMVEGNFNEENLTNEQFSQLMKLVSVLAEKYQIPAEKITGHKDQIPTACPGKNLYELLPLLRKKANTSNFSRVIVGAEQLLSPKYFHHIKGKRIGLITNHTGVLPNGRHLIDVLYDNSDVELSLLFGPEHGLRGEKDTQVANATDPKTGLPIISLYGETRKPTAEMLEKVDVLIFDIQDIGARYYTYIKTMLWTLGAAAENGVPFIVLDRPNPIGGKYVDGSVEPIAQNGTIPITHGMTVGELALMFNANREENGLAMAELRVVPMKNYNRSLWYDETGLPWIKPSPNMLSLKTATVYPATCLIEGTNISEGRGTINPFEQFGAPWIHGETLAKQLNGYHLEGVVFQPTTFVPDSIVDGIKIYPPKFLGETCEGLEMFITNRYTFESAKAGIYILHALKTLYPEQFEFRKERLEGLLDTPEVREKLQSGILPEEIVTDWETELDKFRKKRKKYLLY